MSQNLPARREAAPPMTAVQRSALAREQAKTAMLGELQAKREEISRALDVYQIPYDSFVVAVEVGLNQTMRGDDSFFTKVSPGKFVREVLRAALVGLRPDGKQGAIVRFDDDCSFLPMVEGYVEIIWKSGLIADVNHDVVVDGDTFALELGDSGWVRHSYDLKRSGSAESIGAWCVINLLTGGRIVEVVDRDALQKIAKVNRATKGPRAQGWNREMDRKAPFRRAVKRLPKTARIDLLIDIEDRNVRLENAQLIDGADAPSAKELFKGRPIRRKPKPPPSADTPPPIEELPPDEAWPQPEREPEAAEEADDAPFVLRAVISSKNGLQEFDNVDLWYGDLRQKMQVLDGERLPVFWARNRAHIEAAGRHGHAQEAMQLLAFAKELGLLEAAHDGE